MTNFNGLVPATFIRLFQINRQPLKLSVGKYFGTTISSKNQLGLLLTEKTHSPGEVLPLHFHENAYFCLALEGGWKETVRNKDFYCPSNTLIYHPPQENHKTHFNPSTISKTFNIELTKEWMEKIGNYNLDFLQQRYLFTGNRIHQLFLRLYREFRLNDEFSSLAMEGIALEMMAEMYRGQYEKGTEQDKDWLEEIRKTIENNYKKPFHLSDLAKQVNIHPVHVSRAFRKKYGITLSAYYRKCKIDTACRYLKDNQFRIVEIALETGYYDQSHFSRDFYRVMQMTPGEYRKIFRK